MALAIDRRVYEQALKTDDSLPALIRRWEARGCEAFDRLAFVKNAAALRPTPVVPPHAHDGRSDVPALRYEQRLAAKQLAVQEALARSLLSVQRTIDQYAVVQRLAVAVPYLLIGVGSLATLAADLHLRNRLLESKRERRQETIERLVDVTVTEPQDGGASTP